MSFAMSSFSRSIRSTTPPSGSSTRGIQRSSRSVMTGLWPFLSRPPRDLSGREDEDAREQLPKGGLRHALGDTRTADRGARGGDPDDESPAPADVPVSLLAPDPDEDGRDDR